jgi:hypothetical protein
VVVELPLRHPLVQERELGDLLEVLVTPNEVDDGPAGIPGTA